MDFMSKLNQRCTPVATTNPAPHLGPNVAVTENGGLGYRTTGKALLDLNFSMPAMRTMDPHTVYERFKLAFAENPLLALKWIFYARDVRQGPGERRLFREVMLRMSDYESAKVAHLIKLIPEYGRWDDLINLLDTKLQSLVVDIIRNQLKQDHAAKVEGESVSLMAKWLPSVNASSKETVRRGKLLAKLLGMSEMQYRKMLSEFRRYLKVIEVKMSAKDWSSIDYAAVPSRANLIYKDAFLRNDEERRRNFLAALEAGEATINAGTLYPHDIVAKYAVTYYNRQVPVEPTLEELWKALPDTVDPESRTMVVVDGSGSMQTGVGGTNVQALHVSHALGIYFAERLSGQFRNKYITFSSEPRFVDLSYCKTLRDKLVEANHHTDVTNTNIEAVFNMLLSTAVDCRMSQAEMPANILIISDMEFDSAVGWRESSRLERLFTVISSKWAEAGYKLPRLVFWNVNSRTGTIPVKENELGVALVSGFSVHIAKMVMSGKLDPFEALVEQLMSPRYEAITLAS